MIAVHQCLRHTVDEEGLSSTRISHQDHVAVPLIEVLRPVQQQIPDLRHILTVRLSARTIDQLPIIEACEIEVIEVLCSYDASEMGLLIDKLHLHLFEAVTLLPTDEAGILTVRTGILHLEIVCREAVSYEQLLLLLADGADMVLQVPKLPLLSLPHQLERTSRLCAHRSLQSLQLRKLLIRVLFPCLEMQRILHTTDVIDVHDLIILCIRECHSSSCPAHASVRCCHNRLLTFRC